MQNDLSSSNYAPIQIDDDQVVGAGLDLKINKENKGQQRNEEQSLLP